MVYKFKSGSHINVNPQAAGEMCEELAAKQNLTAKALVDANRPSNAPLHGAFEWNNTKAAENWREHQARHIINCLEIVTQEREPVRAYFSISVKEPGYEHIDAILRHTDSRQKLLQTALAELTAFKRKYAQLDELCKVFEAIEEMEEKGA